MSSKSALQSYTVFVFSTFSSKSKSSWRRPTIVVPQSIKDHYRQPPTLPDSASAEDFRRYHLPLPVSMRLAEKLKEETRNSAFTKSEDTFSTSSLQQEEALWMKTLVRLQSDLAYRIEKEKTNTLLERSGSNLQSSSENKSSPKTLRELARCATYRSRFSLKSSSFHESSNDVMIDSKQTRSRIASNDDVRPTSLQRLTLPAKRRNSDPPTNSLSHTLSQNVPKRNKQADSISVYRPAVLPRPSIFFTKLELAPKEPVISNQRPSDPTIFNGDMHSEIVSSEHASKDSLIPVTVNSTDVPVTQNGENYLHKLASFSNSEVTSKIKQQKLPETGLILNGLSETSSLESDEDMVTSGKDMTPGLNCPAVCLFPKTATAFCLFPHDGDQVLMV